MSLIDIFTEILAARWLCTLSAQPWNQPGERPRRRPSVAAPVSSRAASAANCTPLPVAKPFAPASSCLLCPSRRHPARHGAPPSSAPSACPHRARLHVRAPLGGGRPLRTGPRRRCLAGAPLGPRLPAAAPHPRRPSVGGWGVVDLRMRCSGPADPLPFPRRSRSFSPHHAPRP